MHLEKLHLASHFNKNKQKSRQKLKLMKAIQFQTLLQPGNNINSPNKGLLGAQKCFHQTKLDKTRNVFWEKHNQYQTQICKAFARVKHINFQTNYQYTSCKCFWTSKTEFVAVMAKWKLCQTFQQTAQQTQNNKLKPVWQKCTAVTENIRKHNTKEFSIREIRHHQRN